MEALPGNVTPAIFPPTVPRPWYLAWACGRLNQLYPGEETKPGFAASFLSIHSGHNFSLPLRRINISLRANQSGEDIQFAESFDIAQDYVVQRYRYLDLYWLIGGRRFREACASVHHFIESIIDRRLTTTEKPRNDGRYLFIDAIAEDSRDHTALRDQLINILLAGRDTTACLLSWVL